MNFLWGIIGVLTILALALLISVDRKNINLRTIFGALAIQITFAFLVLETTIGKNILLWLSSGVDKIAIFANEGISFLFGPLVGNGEVFGIEVLGIIIFFSSLIAVLEYFGIMKWIVDLLGGVLTKLLHTTKAESFSAASNIFMGHTEAPLVVKPYLNTMHQSELFAVMVGGLGSVSGSVLVGYSLMGIPLEYLLAASFMAAPSSLLIAKIIFPLPDSERQLSSDYLFDDVEEENYSEDKAVNVVDAAASGAITGLQMVLNIGAVLLAFIALVAMINAVIGQAGNIFGLEALTLEKIIGVLLSPITFLLGIPWEESVIAGELIGQKMVVNEFLAFANLGQLGDAISPKTLMILSFGLAGFGNLGGIGTLIAGLGSLAPDRRSDIAKLGFRAMLGGSLASLLNAAIAGMFF